MKYDSEKHHRRSIRLKGYDYSQTGAYFVTICTHNKECLFGDVIDGGMVLNRAGEIVKTWCVEIKNKFLNVGLDEFVIMPNHIHGIIFVNNVGVIHELPLQANKTRRQMLIPKVIGFYKMNTAKHINKFRNTPGVPVWQRNYHEHIVRNEDELNRIREYIINNPLQWQFDRENPNRVDNEKQRNQFEEYIYGKTKY